MKRYFLIDRENVGSKFIFGVAKLTEEDTIVIFENAQDGELNNACKKVLKESKASVRSVKVYTRTKNAADFQICTYLGMLIKENGNKCMYYIVSKDKGYGSCIDFIKSQMGDEYNVKVIPSCVLDEEDKKMAVFELLEAAIGTAYRKDYGIICNGFKDTDNVREYHNYLQTHLKQEGSIVYNLMKPIYYDAREELLRCA